MKIKGKKTLNIKDIVWDKKIYPRTNYNWQTALTYKNAMRMGNIFPPIKVALFKNKYLLIDGKHRLQARLLNKEKTIEAIVMVGLSYDQMYVEAVKSNTQHGLQLSVQDRKNVIIRLKDMGYDYPKIADIINIPVNTIRNFEVKNVVDTISGKRIGLKKEVKHLAETIVDDKIEQIQESFASNSQLQLINELNSLIKNRLLDMKDKKVVLALRKLYLLLGKYKKIIK